MSKARAVVLPAGVWSATANVQQFFKVCQFQVGFEWNILQLNAPKPQSISHAKACTRVWLMQWKYLISDLFILGLYTLLQGNKALQSGFGRVDMKPRQFIWLDETIILQNNGWLVKHDSVHAVLSPSVIIQGDMAHFCCE